MYNLLIGNYNNYFNRIVKKEDTDFSYFTAMGNTAVIKNINFNPNDGISTQVILGKGDYTLPESATMPTQPDYAILFKTELENPPYADAQIISRWFVIESVRTRSGQYQLTLKRDSIVDNYDKVLNSTCFIEKGYVDKEDSAIFNKEDMTFNEIKDSEFLLKDETQCPWIVGYVAKDRSQNGVIQDTTFTDALLTNVDASDASAKEEYNTFDEFYAAHSDIMGEFGVINYAHYSVQLDVCYANLFSNYDVGITVTLDNNGNVSWRESAYNNNLYLHGQDTAVSYFNRWIWKSWIHDARQKASNSLVSTWKPYLSTFLNYIANRENVEVVSQESTKIKALKAYIKSKPVIKVGDNFYKVFDEFDQNGVATTVSDHPTLNGEMSDLMWQRLNKQPTGIQGHDTIVGTVGPETFTFTVSYNKHKLGFMPIYAECKAKVPASVPLLQDAPYYMFAIPYSDDLTLMSGNSIHCMQTKKSVAIAAAQAIATKAGAGAVYDVQILPYCPIRECIKTEYAAAGTYKLSTGGSYVVKRRPMAGGGIVTQTKLRLNYDYYLKKGNNSDIDIESESIMKFMYSDTFTDDTTVYEGKKVSIDTAGNIEIFVEPEDITPIFTVPYSEYIREDNDNLLTLYLTETYTSTTTNISQFGGITFNKNENFITTVDVGKVVTSDIVLELNNSEQILNTILWATTSKFTFDLYLANYLLYKRTDNGSEYQLNAIPANVISDLEYGFNPMNVKIKSQTEYIRMVSPNYSNFFNINPQYNKGINYFNVDCTYKPYQPYIHVNPDFNGLYGKDFDDVRGLICGGDYSIPLTNDAWSTFELNNKNYQAIFDRDIKTLELNNSIQHMNDVAGAIGGAIKGTATGAVTGAMVGGGYGAIAGAIIGGVTSTIGGVADVQNNELLRNEAMSNKIDQFGYQLKNIQALPQGLMKTSCLTNNNKLYPFIEHYTSTPEEKHALENKITYNGMTIMRVGSPADFIDSVAGNYLKGKLIRIDIQDDSHIVSDINNELNQGVYL